MAGKSTFAFIATVIVSLSLLSAASAWHATFPESLIQRSNILVSRSDIAQDLSAHNAVRQQHGAANLTWSNTLASAAQQWANGCVFKHSDGSLGPYGGRRTLQNLEFKRRSFGNSREHCRRYS